MLCRVHVPSMLPDRTHYPNLRHELFFCESDAWMSWPKPNLKNSLLAFLGQAELTTAKRATRTEAIREFMLTELGAFGDENYPKIMRRIRYASDVQDLWYARGDVMAVLSARDGETLAHEKVNAINAKFKGMLPAGLNSRSSTLGN